MLGRSDFQSRRRNCVREGLLSSCLPSFRELLFKDVFHFDELDLCVSVYGCVWCQWDAMESRRGLGPPWTGTTTRSCDLPYQSTEGVTRVLSQPLSHLPSSDFSDLCWHINNNVSSTIVSWLFFLWASVCLCVYTYGTCECMCGCVHLCPCEDQRTSGVLLHHVLYYSFLSLSLNLERSWQPPSPKVLLTKLRLGASLWPYLAFYLGAGIQTQVYIFVQQILSPTDPFLPPLSHPDYSCMLWGLNRGNAACCSALIIPFKNNIAGHEQVHFPPLGRSTKEARSLAGSTLYKEEKARRSGA